MNTPDFDARARDIVNGYGYLCADRMNDWNIRQFASIVSAALLQAFEEGKLMCQATVTAGGTASSAPVEPLHPDVGGDAEEFTDPSQCKVLRDEIGDVVLETVRDDMPMLWAVDAIMAHVKQWAEDVEAARLHFGRKSTRQIEEPEQREGDEPDPQVETLA